MLTTTASGQRRRIYRARGAGPVHSRLPHVQVVSRTPSAPSAHSFPQRRRRPLRPCSRFARHAAPHPALRQSHRPPPQGLSSFAARCARASPARAALVRAAVHGAMRPCARSKAGLSLPDLPCKVFAHAHILMRRLLLRRGPAHFPPRRSKRPPPLSLARSFSQVSATQRASQRRLPWSVACASKPLLKSWLSAVCFASVSPSAHTRTLPPMSSTMSCHWTCPIHVS